MKISSVSDWVTRSTVWIGASGADTMDLVHFGKNLQSDTLDPERHIARGNAAVAARRLSAALWNVNPSVVSVAAQATSFGRTTAGFLSVSHAVAWPVTSKLAEASYHVLRPVSAVLSMGNWILVRFHGGEVVRFAHNDDSIWACVTHVWNDVTVEHFATGEPIEKMNAKAVEPYSDRHPYPGPKHPIEVYCPRHDLFNCWLCAEEVRHPAPPPLPPIPEIVRQN